MANTAFDHASALTIPGSTTNNGLVRWGDTSGTSFGNITGITSDGSNITLLTRGEIRFSDADSSNFIALESPATVGTSYTMTLPAAVPSAADYLKVTSYSGGAGVLEWASVSADTNTTYLTSWVDSSTNAILRLTPSSGSADDLTIVAGTNITLTPSGDNLTIDAASGGVGCGPLRISNGAACAPAYSFSGDNNSGFYHTGTADTIELIAGGGGSLRLDSDSKVYIKETANGCMGRGLTINMGGYDDEILALKSSDAAHGMTGKMETDTFASFRKYVGAQGGLQIRSVSNGVYGRFDCVAIVGCGSDSKDSGGGANYIITATRKAASGGGQRAMNSNANLVGIRCGDGVNNYTRFLWDAEGSAHAEVEWTTFDDYCDIELLRGVHGAMTPCYAPTYKNTFGRDMVYNLEQYAELGLVGKDSMHWETREDGRVQLRGMVNTTSMMMLHHSTIIQMADKFNARLDGLETQLKSLSEGK